MDFLLVLLAVVGLLAYVVYKNKAVRIPPGIPHPPSVPILGNLPQVLKNFPRFNEYLLELHEQYGDTFALSIMGQQLTIWTCSPKNCEHMLKTNFDNYVKGQVFHDKFIELLGNGIFNVDGKEWYNQRKTAALMFNVTNFRDNMLNVFVNHGAQLLEILGNVPNGKSIDMQNLFFRYTLDCIGEIGFGVEINSMGGHSEFAACFDGAQAHIQTRFVSPFWRLKKYFFAPSERKFSSQVATLDAYARAVVADRKNSTDLRERNDLLSIFMEKKGEDGQEYTDDFYRDLIMNFVIAGRDTTAQALSWMFYQLSLNPHVEEKMIKEIDEVLGGNPPTFQTIKKLKYCDAVFSETVRLHPSVPKDGKFAVQDDVLPDGTVVPAKSLVAYIPWVMGRSKRIWGEDAREFKPERWLSETWEKPSPFKFIPFQAGPRTCLGQNMAYLEGKTAAAIILQKYKLRLVPGHPVKPQTNITLPMEYGLEMNVIPRT